MAGWKQYCHWERQKTERQALVELPRVDLTKANNIFNQMRQQQWSPPVQAVPDAPDFDSNSNKQFRSSENDYNSSMQWSLAENNNYANKMGHWSSTESDRIVKIQQWMSSSARMVPDATQIVHSSPKQNQPVEEVYSRKVFIGGLPPDIDEEILLDVFQRIGSLTIDWPHKDQSTNRFPPQGYAFLCFEQECSVHNLLNVCTRSHGKYYTRLSSSSIIDKLVQVRPWMLADAEYNTQEKYKTDHRLTVFVGGVPRTITAEELALLIKKKFDGVCYAAIEVDGDYKYPKGAARVSFGSRQSYRAAVSTRFIKTSDSEKQMEMKPFLVEIAMCESCGCMSTRQFCASMLCLKYLCGPCWVVDHVGPKINHKPVVKSSAERTRHRYPSVQQ